MGWFYDISLVSDQAIWGLRIALLVAAVWVVLRWHRSASATVWSFVRRIVSLAVVSLLTTMTLAAPLNAEYGWYPTIGDLMPASDSGTVVRSPENAAAAVAADHTSSALITGARTRPAVSLKLQPTKSGAGAGYEDFTVRGARSGMTGQVTVWFPKQYLSEPNREFPVIETFHGIAPAPYAVFNVVKLDQIVSTMADQGQMKPALIVSPHWAFSGRDNECVDSAAGGKVETWLTQDVPAWLYSTFRVSPGRDSFAAWGMSAGGWCANMSAMLHPDTFATAVSMGGYWRPDFDPSFVPFAEGTPEWNRYDLVALAENHPPAVALWGVAGKNDDLAIPSTKLMEKAVRAPTSLTFTELPRGGHNTDLWIPFAQPSMTWLASTSPAFTAT